MLRSFGWRDLPTLYRYRHLGLFLDSAQAVTRGTSLFPTSLLHHLKPSMHTQTWIYNSDVSGRYIVGQSIHVPEASCAHISFLAPVNALQALDIQKLIEQLAKKTGQQGAFYLLAEVETGLEIFESLRMSGFTPYAQQRIWQIAENFSKKRSAATWKIAQSVDRANIQGLCRQTTPEQIQHIEARQTASLQGLICYQGTDVMGFARVQYGSQGIWIHPYLHHAIANADSLIMDLLSNIPEGRSRPFYICARSYQANLEPALDALGATPGPQQTNMVKHLAAQKKIRNQFALPNMDGQPEITMPFTTPRDTLQPSHPKIKLYTKLK